MSWTQAQLDVCQEAFYILRQDIGLPTPATADTDTSLEWRKCKLAYESARQEVLAAHDWTFAQTPAARTDISLWPGDVRNALVYCLARELAIPIAGRIADMQTIDALYRDKLRRAIIRELNEALATNSDPVLAQLLANFKSDDPGLVNAYQVYTQRALNAKTESDKEVKATLDVSTLDNLAQQASACLSVARLAQPCGLDANFVQLKMQEYQAKIQEWRRIKLNEALATNSDPVLAQLLANFKSDDPGLVNAFTVYTQRVDAVKGAAYEEVEAIHNWRWIDPSWTASTPLETKIAAMDGLTRAALVALVAQKLAVPCGLSPETIGTFEQLYQSKLRLARVTDLESTEIEDPLVREVFTLLRSNVAADKNLPRDMKTLADKIGTLSRMARRAVLSAHDWSFAETDLFCDPAIDRFPDARYPYRAQLPEDTLRVSAVYGRDGELRQWKVRGGDLYATGSFRRIVYVRDIEDYATWDDAVYRAFVMRLAADVARAVATDPKSEQYREALYREALEDARARDSSSDNTPDEIWGDLEDPLARD